MINQESGETAVFVDDERFWQKYAALRFLVPEEQITLYRPENGLDVDITQNAAVYTYPFMEQDFVESILQPPVLVSVGTGSLARGDLETEAVPLFLRYGVEPAPNLTELARFGEMVGLYGLDVIETEDGKLLVDLIWETETAVLDNLTVFVHAVNPDGLIAQSDSPPANGFWQADWWQPGLYLRDRHEIVLPENVDSSDYQLHIGWYDAATKTRLPVTAADGTVLGDTFIWPDHGPSE
jgi:hypothetical protein